MSGFAAVTNIMKLLKLHSIPAKSNQTKRNIVINNTGVQITSALRLKKVGLKVADVQIKILYQRLNCMDAPFFLKSHKKLNLKRC